MRSIAIVTRLQPSMGAAVIGDWRSKRTRSRSCWTQEAPFTGLSEDHPMAVTEETGHGRKETRKAIVISAKSLEACHEFPGLKGFGRIKATRLIDDKIQTATRYFALSWMPSPEVLLSTVRDHWAIENALHWQLDVSLREDAARNRKDNGRGNIAVLRRRDLDLVSDTFKGSISIKLKRAG